MRIEIFSYGNAYIGIYCNKRELGENSKEKTHEI